MSVPLEDYALLSDTYSSALVSKAGSVDWLGFPRFDSAPFFAALLGEREHGHWALAPVSHDVTTTRRYREGTLVLETEHRTPEGSVFVIDALPVGESTRGLLRVVEGRSGRVAMRTVLRFRFDYGSIIPWVRRVASGLEVIAGPDALSLRTPVELRGEDFSTVGEFTVTEGDRVSLELTWYPSHEDPPGPIDCSGAIARTEDWWRSWSSRCAIEGNWADDVRDSLVVLKGLSYAPTGGIVAAPTTSLPETIGGARNWDYRFCWVRDATFTLMALMESGYVEEAIHWRDWLVRAVAGEPSKLQSLYGLHGERRLPEVEIAWLPGYEGSRPVRVGNAASEQFQLDVYGELMDAMHQARGHGMAPERNAWDVQKVLMDFLEGHWRDPDEGIWEVRGPRRHFTHSKLMAWVAADRAVHAVERFGLDGHVERWRGLRDEIHREVCERGVDDRGVFTQSYGSPELDASVLMMPLVGFLPPDDPRVRATVEAIEQELCEDGFVLRYRPRPDLDGQVGREGAFLLCTFWLASNLALIGRHDDAVTLFERLLSLRNDVGLLAEEYDPVSGRLLGNFPQAFSHVALVNSAWDLRSARSGRASVSDDASNEGPG